MTSSLLARAPARLRMLVAADGALPAIARQLVALMEKQAAGSVAQPKACGMLRALAASAWHMGAYVKPKTTPPGRDGQPARAMLEAKPPSNRAFHADETKSMADPARGARVGTLR